MFEVLNYNHSFKQGYKTANKKKIQWLIYKNSCFAILINILYLVAITMLIMGFFLTNEVDFITQQHVNLNQIPDFHYGYYNLRAIGLYIMAIAFGINIIVFYQIIDLKKLNSGFRRHFFCLFPGISLFYIWKHFQAIREYSFINHIKSNFKLENNSEYNRRFNLKYNIILCVAIINIMSIVFALLPSRTFNIDVIWYRSFSFYTQQTNCLLAISLVIYIIQPRLKIFKNNNWLVILSTYIIVVGSAFSVSIPYLDWNEKYADTWKLAKTSYFHFFNPLLFSFMSIFLITKYKTNNIQFKELFRRTSIMPIIYAFYLITIPFVGGLTVYGRISNPNPKLLWLHKNKSWPGDYLTLFGVVGMALLFTFVLYGMYRINGMKPKYAIWSENIIVI